VENPVFGVQESPVLVQGKVTLMDIGSAASFEIWKR